MVGVAQAAVGSVATLTIDAAVDEALVRDIGIVVLWLAAILGGVAIIAAGVLRQPVVSTPPLSEHTPSPPEAEDTGPEREPQLAVTADLWFNRAMLKVLNRTARNVEVELKVEVMRGTGESESAYPLTGMIGYSPALTLKSGDDSLLCVAEQVGEENGRAILRFHKADEEAPYFLRTVPFGWAVLCKIAIYTEPPLSEPLSFWCNLELDGKGKFNRFHISEAAPQGKGPPIQTP